MILGSYQKKLSLQGSAVCEPKSIKDGFHIKAL